MVVPVRSAAERWTHRGRQLPGRKDQTEVPRPLIHRPPPQTRPLSFWAAATPSPFPLCMESGTAQSFQLAGGTISQTVPEACARPQAVVFPLGCLVDLPEASRAGLSFSAHSSVIIKKMPSKHLCPKAGAGWSRLLGSKCTLAHLGLRDPGSGRFYPLLVALLAV